MSDSVRGMTMAALAGCDIHLVQTPVVGIDRLVIGLSSAVALERISGRLLHFLARIVEEYDGTCRPEETIRLRVALHEPAPDADTSAAVPRQAHQLADAEVLHRVLAAAPNEVISVAMSDTWFGRLRQNAGCDRVLVADGPEPTAWLKVPGRSHPPGLLPTDRPAEAPSRPASAHVPPPGKPPAPMFTVAGPMTVHGSVVQGDQHNSATHINYGYLPGKAAGHE
jgi:hypothetical protein